jgi:hypothetical protein
MHSVVSFTADCRTPNYTLNRRVVGSTDGAERRWMLLNGRSACKAAHVFERITFSD